MMLGVGIVRDFQGKERNSQLGEKEQKFGKVATKKQKNTEKNQTKGFSRFLPVYHLVDVMLR